MDLLTGACPFDSGALPLRARAVLARGIGIGMTRNSLSSSGLSGVVVRHLHGSRAEVSTVGALGKVKV